VRCGPSSSGFRNGRLLRRRRGSRSRRARRLRPGLTRSPIRDHKRERAKRPSPCPRGLIRPRRQSTKRPASTSRRALNSVYVTCELVPVVRCTERAVRRSERLQLVSATASMTVRGSYRSEFAALWDGFALPFPPSLPQ